MEKEYTQKEFWKLYEKLPQELKEAFFSSETTENIWRICERYEVEEVGEVAKYVGKVLLGLLPPEEFQKTLEKDLKLEKERIEKLSREIFRFIFYPVKSALEEIYKMEILPPKEPAETLMEIEKRLEKEIEKKPEKKRDIYREPIE